MLDTFLYGTGSMLVLAKFLDVPALIAVPVAIAATLAVMVDLSRELAKQPRQPGEDRPSGESGEDPPPPPRH